MWHFRVVDPAYLMVSGLRVVDMLKSQYPTCDFVMLQAALFMEEMQWRLLPEASNKNWKFNMSSALVRARVLEERCEHHSLHLYLRSSAS